MANKLLKKVDDITPSVAPSFLSSTADTQKIVNAGTSGMETMDMIFKHVNKIANNLTELERQNELMDVQSQADENLKEYELSWGDKAKFDDENYDSYISGLKNVYAENKQLIKQTKYATASDVETWNHNLEMSQNNNEFTVGGLRSQYKIKQVTDKTLINISKSKEAYIKEENEEKKKNILKNVNKYIDNLKYTGMTVDDREKYKVKTIVDYESQDITHSIEKIVNDTKLTNDEKRKRLADMEKGFSSKDILQKDAENLIGEGILNKDKNMAQLHMDIMGQKLQENVVGQDGIIQKAIQEINNKEIKENKAINSRIADWTKNRSSGDLLGQIGVLNGQDINGETLIDNHKLLTSMTNFETKSYGNFYNEKTFVPMVGKTALNSVRSTLSFIKQDPVNKRDIGIAIYNALDSSISNFSEDDRNYDIKSEYTKRQYISEGLVSQADVTIFSNTKIDGEEKKTIMKDFHYADRVAWGGVNAIKKGSKTYKVVSDIFSIQNEKGEKNIISNQLQNIIINTIQGRIKQGKYPNILSSVEINNSTLIDVMGDKDIQSDIEQISNSFDNSVQQYSIDYSSVNLNISDNNARTFINANEYLDIKN